MEAVGEALNQTLQASSMVENLNLRLSELAAILFESPLLHVVAEARTGGQNPQATADRGSASTLAGTARLQAISKSVETDVIQ